jgi:hypothetical protein
MRGKAVYVALSSVLVVRQVFFVAFPQASSPPTRPSSDSNDDDLSAIASSPWSSYRSGFRPGGERVPRLAPQPLGPDATAASAPAATSGPRQKTLHVLYGLSGNIPEFFEEFVAGLKSVLLNAPMEAPLEIHLIVDSKAHAELTTNTLPKLGLNGSVWRNPIFINLYPVSEDLKASQMDRIMKSLPVSNATVATRVGPGGLFRLFAGEILPSNRTDLETVLYLDNEILVFANLAEILDVQDSKYMFQIGTHNDLCSGIMILNLKPFAQFLTYLSQVDAAMLPGDFDDQLMLIRVKQLLREREAAWHKATKAFDEAVARSASASSSSSGSDALYPNGTASIGVVAPPVPPVMPPPLVGDLPERWHVNLAHGYRRDAHKLRTARPSGFGMLHFNGIRDNADTWWSGTEGVWKYCTEYEDCQKLKDVQQAFRETWNLAEYYVRLPFEYAKSFGRSVVRDDGGTLLVVRTVCPAVDPNCTY